MPFNVVYKSNIYQLVTVYHVRMDSHGYPVFLVYENGQWMWRSAKHFVPWDGDANDKEFYISS